MKVFKNYGKYIALGLAVLSFIMLLIPGAIRVTLLGNTTASDNNAFGVIFSEDQFVVLGFFGLLLLVVGAVVTMLPQIPSKYRYLIGAGLLLLGGIFLFVFPSTIDSIIKIKPGVPVIFAGIFALLGAVVDGGLGYLEFK